VKRFFHWIRSAWLMLGITFFLLALLEAACLIHLRKTSQKRPEYSWMEADGYGNSEWVPAYLEEFLSTRLQWEPYLYWRRRTFKGTYINIGEDGFRRTERGAGHPQK
jgi:hypothetical protein